jgi:hypothetical protein
LRCCPRPAFRVTVCDLRKAASRRTGKRRNGESGKRGGAISNCEMRIANLTTTRAAISNCEMGIGRHWGAASGGDVPSVVIHDFGIQRIGILPMEADAPLVMVADTSLSARSPFSNSRRCGEWLMVRGRTCGRMDKGAEGFIGSGGRVRSTEIGPPPWPGSPAATAFLLHLPRSSRRLPHPPIQVEPPHPE